MEYKETVKKVIAEVCRLLLGVVFIFSGTVKAVDPMGGAIKIGDYLTSFGLDKPTKLINEKSRIGLRLLRGCLGDQ